MATLETTPLLEQKAGATPASPEARKWKPAAIVADIATLGTGTLVAGVFNAALVFVVPKLVSVEDYGYWRIFMLYAGYVGFLHFGFADGALLRWAGRPLKEFHHEIGPAVKYLLWQHLAVLLPACLFAMVWLRGPLRFVGIAVAVYAVVINVVSTQQYALQAARIFRPVAISAATAPALFLGFVLLWPNKWQRDYREITSLYTAGWLIALAFLLAWTRPWTGLRRTVDLKRLAGDCLSNGWAMLLANGGAALIAYGDRLAVSWAATIQNFAQYSLAASAMGVSITAIQACNKVFFSHLAGVTAEDRKRIYAISSRSLLIVWAILLPYYFALDAFVRSVLPKYIPSLAYARVLLLGIPFLAVVQILQTSYAYLHGMQRGFLGRTIAVLSVSLAAIFVVAFRAGSLRLVAEVQVFFLGMWWVSNEWSLRSLTGQRIGDWMKFLGIFALAGTDYWLTTSWMRQTVTSALVYYVGLVIVLMIFCREELRLWARLMQRRGVANRPVVSEGE